jgi:hypothetical protein
MWTDENRGRYDPSELRYPSDLMAMTWRRSGTQPNLTQLIVSNRTIGV